jgi:hypothetical protein
MYPSKFRAKAVDVGLGFTNNGNEQIGVVFEVVEGDCAGEEITWYGFFTEKTAQRTIESLRYCGWQGNDLASIDVEDIPKVVQIVVEEDEYEGKRRLRVQWVNRDGAGLAMKTRLAGSAAASFAARMKGLCMAVKPEPVQVERAQRPEGDSHDRPPF